MPDVKKPLLFSALILPAVCALPHASGAIVYTETFANATGGNALPPVFGWAGYLGANAATVADASSNDRAGSSSLDGPGAAAGYLFSANGITTNAAFALVENAPFTPVNANTISWQMGNSAATISVRLLVKQGSSWYASSTTYTTAGGFTQATFASAPEVKTLAFSLTAANWLNFTLDPGNAMALGGTIASNLASNQIDGIGFYVVHAGGPTTTMRLDNLSVDGVPEPSAPLLTGLSGLALLALRRRKS